MRLVVLGGGESGVGTAILGKKKGYDVFVSDFGKIKENYKEVGKQGPNEAMLRRILKASGADIILMVRLNELEENSDNRGKEMLEKLVIKADVMSVNAFTNKVYSD